MKKTKWLLVAVVPFAAMALFLWAAARPPALRYARAKEMMPQLSALAKEKVTFLREQDWCRALAYEKGKFASPLKGTCTLGDGFQLFTPEAEDRFAALAAQLRALPYQARWISLRYGAGGEIRRAEISLAGWFDDGSLFFEPGYELPEDLPAEQVHSVIDSDWYHQWTDWN